MVTFAPVKAAGRVLRSPRHTFQIRQRPFEITPFLLAPVLPGETMKNLLIQSRAVTKPVKNPLVGWWLEYYFFYVKHRDLDERDTLTAMMLDPSTSVSALLEDVTNAWYYQANGTIRWSELCLKRVVEEYFRDEGDAWDSHVISVGRPAAKLNGDTWLQSAVDTTDILTPDDPQLTVGADDKVTGSEIDNLLRQYEFLRTNNLVQMTYEDWLGTFGIKTPKVELHRPELLRYVRDWQYPSNTIEPSTGAPSSAVSWSIAERGDKDRLFTEPGFIFGVTVVRPKVYYSKQDGAAAGMLDNALAWLPAIMRDDPATSLQNRPTGTSALTGVTNPHTWDVRDLFLYGDQFVNFGVSETDASMVALPNAGFDNLMYPSSADADALFAAAAPSNVLAQDGVVSLQILSHMRDETP